MRNFLAALIGSIPGALVGVVFWTALAVLALALYWVGYEMLYLGLLCGRGKLGLGWLTPPSDTVQNAIRGWVMFLTALAFTLGEVFAGLLGAFLGGEAGVCGMRFVRFLLSICRRERDE